MKRGASLLSSRRNLNFFNKAGRDWEKAWQMNLTPWDLKGAVNPPLIQSIESGIMDPKGKKALIPGCGSGYECVYLKKAGFAHVTGMDISKTAVAQAQQVINESKEANIIIKQADFFQLESETKYDFIFDYLFFAALDPPLRTAWAKSMQNILQPEDGILATLIFPLYREGDDRNVGPPYPVEVDDYEAVLKPLQFELLRIDEVRFFILSPVITHL